MAGFKEEIKSQFGSIITNRIENDKIFDNICFGISKRIEIAASASAIFYGSFGFNFYEV